MVGKNGNNAFPYDERVSGSGSVRAHKPRLWITDLKSGKLSDLDLGKKIVFEDFDDGILRSCVGLKHFIRAEFCGVPMVIFDNHNHAFYFWAEAFYAGAIKRGAVLVHVDQHKDMRAPEKLYAGKNLDDAFLYTNQILNVGNYIVPAVKGGFFDRTITATSEDALEQICAQGDAVALGNFVLNLDMDFFAPEMKVDFLRAQKNLRALAKRAKLITVATSPFFIDQKIAIDLLRELF